MSNNPPFKKYTSLRLSPLHPCVMSLFDVVPDMYHCCKMDNLYNSVSFCKSALNNDKKCCVKG